MTIELLRPTFIDPFIDFSFKRLFATDESKPILIGFLNEVFKGRKYITAITYSKNEYPGEIKNEGGATLDVICTDADGSKFLIEVQCGYQKYFKERALFYTSRLISEQAPKGKRKKWNYNLTEVYLIALLDDYSLPASTNDEYLHDICLTNRRTGKIFYDKLGYTYVEMRKFVKTADQLDSTFDKWLYALKHMKEFEEKPECLNGPEFEQLFSLAKYANLNKEERDMYNTSLKHKWDNANVLDFAVEEAEQRAARKKAFEIARELKNQNLPIEQIVKATKLSVQEIQEA